jgi:predicted metalloendopeptidase
MLLIALSESENDDNNDVCTTKACKAESENVLAKLDQTVDPCDDFYLFACGNFLNKTVIPDDKTSYDVTTSLDDQLKKNLNEILNGSITGDDIGPFVNSKKLYRACVNEGEVLFCLVYCE